jgi:cytochrome c-type biogenesis protein CcmH|tara:strand:- start:1089 stop:1499 length:411 start_codon:yes stop_codon:yes gene_type:complete
MLSKKIKIIVSIFILQLSFNSCYAVEPEEILNNTKQELRARNISKNIRCMICQNQSIDDSSAPIAKDLRILIRNKIKDGNNDEEIYQFLTDRYGDFILLNPSFKLNTFALWLLPLIFFIIGLIVIFVHNKKSKKLL